MSVIGDKSGKIYHSAAKEGIRSVHTQVGIDFNFQFLYVKNVTAIADLLFTNY